MAAKRTCNTANGPTAVPRNRNSTRRAGSGNSCWRSEATVRCWKANRSSLINRQIAVFHRQGEDGHRGGVDRAELLFVAVVGVPMAVGKLVSEERFENLGPQFFPGRLSQLVAADAAI